MQKLKILVVEDELIIAETLKAMLEELGYEVPAIFRSGTEAIENFKSGYADILIMDINLANNTNGIETSKEIHKISQVPVIYITENTEEHYRKKAISETNAVDYLIKPFSRMDISIAIDFALKSLKQSGFKETHLNADSYFLNDCIYVKRRDHSYGKVSINDIRYLEADGSYCKLVIAGGEVLTFSENLGFFQEKLSFLKELMRVHRSFIVNLNFIDRIKESSIVIDKKEVPVSKSYRDELFGRLRII